MRVNNIIAKVENLEHTTAKSEERKALLAIFAV